MFISLPLHIFFYLHELYSLINYLLVIILLISFQEKY